MRKSKKVALEAIKNIQELDKIKMLNVKQTTNPKPKAYSNESKWLDSVEFDTLAAKGSNELRKELPNSSIKVTKKELLMKLEEIAQDNERLRDELNTVNKYLSKSGKREKKLEYALGQSESAAQNFAFQANEAESKAKRLKKVLKELFSKYEILRELVSDSHPMELNMTALSDYQSKLEIIETTEQLDEHKKELASSNDNEARKTPPKRSSNKDMNDSGKMLSSPKKRKIDAESSQPKKKHNPGNFFDSNSDDDSKAIKNNNTEKRKTRKRKKTDSQTSSTLPPTNKRSRIDIYGGGITNPRFQCYINTAIQLLTQCPGFQNDILQFFHQNQEHFNQPLHKDGKLYQRLTFAEGLLRAWWDIQTAREEKTTVTINDNWLRNIFGYNDSQECTFYDGLIRMFTKVDNDSTSFEDSICFKYFGFNVKQTETCNACGHVETTEKKEIALPFSISNGLKEQEKIGINELIKYYEEPEKLDDYKCDGCNQQGHAVKVNSIVTPYPKYFLSSIMRYKFDGVDSSRTSIEIDLEDPLEGMNLIGVIAHSGGSSINSGHYTCLLRNENENCWLNYNDTRVERHDKIPHHYEKNAYVLLYRNSTGDNKELSSESETPQNDLDNVDQLSENFDTISIADDSMSEYDVRYSSQDLDTSTDSETDIEMTKWHQLPLI